ncbi:MAG: tRNA (adenosine(37)-N6)-dimethylallyltransferase MiaA [Oligoflexia bacterium]|nr:tRNA (adenosine(37)-N6)-dimethylallyltransferase MiaA [Oligoflexia bacterium]
MDLNLKKIKKPKVMIISGPTASGKTKVAIDLAKAVRSSVGISVEIVNFDSLLFYRELKIGTAAPSLQEMQEVPHHLVGIVSVRNPLNANSFMLLAQEIIAKLHQQDIVPLLVGGSGFYLRALLHGMYESPSTPSIIKSKSDELYLNEGIVPFLRILEQEDSDSLQKLHINDHYRIRRAVEHYWTHGTKFSLLKDLWERQQKQHQEQHQERHQNIHGWELLHFYLEVPSVTHRQLIAERVDVMLENGLQEEVTGLLAQGFSGEEKPLQSIGYKEMVDCCQSKNDDNAERMGAIIQTVREKIITSTRRLAKAQRTWFRKVIDKQQYNPLLCRKHIFDQGSKFCIS